MITGSNTDVIAKQLEEFSKEVERKMKNMVAGFAREVALAASENTPVGSAEDVVKEGAYHNYYLDRNNEFGLPVEVGYHSGAWEYTEGSPTFRKMIFTKEEMSNDVFNEAEASYQLGNSFAIAAIGPGYAALEGGSSQQKPNGIGDPTIAQIMASQQSDLKRYYEAG